MLHIHHEAKRNTVFNVEAEEAEICLFNIVGLCSYTNSSMLQLFINVGILAMAGIKAAACRDPPRHVCSINVTVN